MCSLDETRIGKESNKKVINKICGKFSHEDRREIKKMENGFLSKWMG